MSKLTAICLALGLGLGPYARAAPMRALSR
jgi:hypothetical protein